jgi:hypothetical protein
MKKILFFIAFIIAIIQETAQAQAPQAMNYQGIARSIEGKALANKSLKLHISIIDGKDNGETVYSETHVITTNQFGLYNLKIGEGKPLSGLFENIQWQLHNKYIKVELNENGTLVDLGTTQLLSVPYALYAEHSGTAAIADNDKSARAGTPNYLSKFDATGASNAEINSQVFDNGNSVGISTAAPGAKFHVNGADANGNVMLLQHNNANGFGRYAFWNDMGSANRATFTRYGSTAPGNIGGLTQFPQANLLTFGCNVGGTLISTNGNVGMAVIQGGNTKLKMYADNTTGNVGIGGNATAAARVHLSNTDGANTDMRITNNTSGHTATDGLVISENANNASITNAENASLSLGTNNTTRVAIGSAGNVIVNAPTSGNALQINGTVQINGGAPGVGKVLTSDASGNASWQTPAGGAYTAGSGIGISGNVISNTGDVSNTNELQTLSLSGNNLSLSSGGGTVALPSGTNYTAGTGISIAGNAISATDNSATNEIQTLSLSGNNLSLSNGGGSVALPSGTNYTAGTGISIAGNAISATDNSATNEIQTLSLSGNNISLSNGGGTITLPAGSAITASNGLTVTAADVQLGGTLTQNTTIDNDASDLSFRKTTINNPNGTHTFGTPTSGQFYPTAYNNTAGDINWISSADCITQMSAPLCNSSVLTLIPNISLNNVTSFKCNILGYPLLTGTGGLLTCNWTDYINSFYFINGVINSITNEVTFTFPTPVNIVANYPINIEIFQDNLGSYFTTLNPSCGSPDVLNDPIFQDASFKLQCATPINGSVSNNESLSYYDQSSFTCWGGGVNGYFPLMTFITSGAITTTQDPYFTFQSNGTIKYEDGNQATNKVLTSDASGNASWQSLPAAQSYTAGSGININGSNVISAVDVSATNELQNLSLTGASTINISGGTGVTIPNASASSGGVITSANFNTWQAKVDATRTISTTAPLTGGGDLSANRTIGISQANTTTAGFVSATDFTTFNNKIGKTGTVTNNYIPKFSGTSNITNSIIQDNGTTVSAAGNIEATGYNISNTETISGNGTGGNFAGVAANALVYRDIPWSAFGITSVPAGKTPVFSISVRGSFAAFNTCFVNTAAANFPVSGAAALAANTTRIVARNNTATAAGCELLVQFVGWD